MFWPVCMRREETFFKRRRQKNLIVLLLTNNSSGNRRVIPSYVVWKIRKTFSEEGGLYIPYTEEWNNFYNVLVYTNMKNKFF